MWALNVFYQAILAEKSWGRHPLPTRFPLLCVEIQQFSPLIEKIDGLTLVSNPLSITPLPKPITKTYQTLLFSSKNGN